MYIFVYLYTCRSYTCLSTFWEKILYSVIHMFVHCFFFLLFYNCWWNLATWILLSLLQHGLPFKKLFNSLLQCLQLRLQLLWQISSNFMSEVRSHLMPSQCQWTCWMMAPSCGSQQIMPLKNNKRRKTYHLSWYNF